MITRYALTVVRCFCVSFHILCRQRCAPQLTSLECCAFIAAVPSHPVLLHGAPFFGPILYLTVLPCATVSAKVPPPPPAVSTKCWFCIKSPISDVVEEDEKADVSVEFSLK